MTLVYLQAPLILLHIFRKYAEVLQSFINLGLKMSWLIHLNQYPILINLFVFFQWAILYFLFYFLYFEFLIQVFLLHLSQQYFWNVFLFLHILLFQSNQLFRLDLTWPISKWFLQLNWDNFRQFFLGNQLKL